MVRPIRTFPVDVNVRWPNADIARAAGARPQDSLFFIQRSAGPIEQVGPAESVALRILGLAIDAKEKIAQILKGQPRGRCSTESARSPPASRHRHCKPSLIAPTR